MPAGVYPERRRRAGMTNWVAFLAACGTHVHLAHISPNLASPEGEGFQPSPKGTLMTAPRPHYSNTPSFHYAILAAALPRMKSAVRLFQPRSSYVSINLRRRNIGMAEHRLHGTEIGAAFEKVGRERMA